MFDYEAAIADLASAWTPYRAAIKDMLAERSDASRDKVQSLGMAFAYVWHKYESDILQFLIDKHPAFAEAFRDKKTKQIEFDYSKKQVTMPFLMSL